ncbi:MAG: hypothetical protein H6728_05685 [Myxococcales bacterium]|nr:hypothetical protein [Myxococcales bacterium]
MLSKRFSWIGYVILLLTFLIIWPACTPPLHQTSCQTPADCGDAVYYDCLGGSCIPKQSKEGPSKLAQRNPLQPDWSHGESLLEGGSTEPITPDGTTKEQEPEDGGNIEPPRPDDIIQDGRPDGTTNDGRPDDITPPVCREGQTRPCYTARVGCTRNQLNQYDCQGPCKAGIQRCVNGQWSDACEGEILPAVEKCDNIDNDCDGKINNLLPEHLEPCSKQEGVCAGSRKKCDENGNWINCTEQDYKDYAQQNGTEYGPEYQYCFDKLDNDCQNGADRKDTTLTGCAWSSDYPSANNTTNKVRWRATTQGDGALFVIGEYTGSPELKSINQTLITLPYTLNRRGFVGRLNPFGEFVWLQVFGPNGPDPNFFVTAITLYPAVTGTPSQKELFITGTYSSTISADDLSGGTSQKAADLKFGSPRGIFVLKYRTSDGAFLKSTKIEAFDAGTTHLSVNAIVYGKGLYIAGAMKGKGQFSKNAETRYFYAYNKMRPYVIKLHSTSTELYPEKALVLDAKNDGISAIFGLAYDHTNGRLFAVGTLKDGLLGTSTDSPPEITNTFSKSIDTRGGNDAFLLELDNDITYKSINLFGSQAHDIARSIVYDPQKGFFIAGDVYNESGSNVELSSANSTLKLAQRGLRSMFLAHFNLGKAPVWLAGAGKNNRQVSLGPRVVNLENQVAATHLSVHANTLFVGGLFFGDFQYYLGPNVDQSNASYQNTSNTMRIQSILSNKTTDVFLLALDPTNGSLKSNQSAQFFTSTGYTTFAGLAFDDYNVAYGFFNQNLPNVAQLLAGFDPFYPWAPFPPEKASIQKSPVPR